MSLIALAGWVHLPTGRKRQQYCAECIVISGRLLPVCCRPKATGAPTPGCSGCRLLVHKEIVPPSVVLAAAGDGWLPIGAGTMCGSGLDFAGTSHQDWPGDPGDSDSAAGQNPKAQHPHLLLEHSCPRLPSLAAKTQGLQWCLGDTLCGVALPMPPLCFAALALSWVPGPREERAQESGFLR